ncbi:MAG: glycosyltransferase family 4 protein [Opitutales bacterium]|nr:glycosyltransferase family 4 protein [Opitutales bacterium]
MNTCILTDTTLPSFIHVGDLYAATFERLGWQVTHRTLAEPGELSGFDIVFHNVNGRNFRTIPGQRNIALFVHEWSRYPPEWIPYFDAFDAIWTTTEHCQRIAQESGLKPPAHWIPPAVDLDPVLQKTDYTASQPFHFLYVGAWHFRKGLHLLFRAWDIAFPEPGAARLTIKTSADCPFKTPRSDIEIITDPWSQDTLQTAYTAADCYVSASLGEGWGLPIMEAIRAGLPICANTWGGHGSMIDDTSAFVIPHQEIPQTYASRPELYAPDQTCGYSSPEAIAETLRQAVLSTPEKRHAISARAAVRLSEHYGLFRLKAKMLRFFNLQR